MGGDHLALGRHGEEIAQEFLEKSGFTILRKNYSSPLGEIDFVALEGNTLCFIEVKTRRGDDFGVPEEAVTSAKRKKLTKAATGFLKQYSLKDQESRFDVVSVLCDAQGAPEKIELIRNAFEAVI